MPTPTPTPTSPHSQTWFALLFFSVGSLLFLHCLVVLAVVGAGLAWFGAFLSTAAVVVYWVGLLSKKKPLTREVLWSLLAGIVVGLGCVIYANVTEQWLWWPFSYAVLTLCLSLIYVPRTMQKL